MAELDGLDRVLTNDTAVLNGDHEGERIFDSISSAFKQFIVQGKDWLGSAKNLVRICVLDNVTS